MTLSETDGSVYLGCEVVSVAAEGGTSVQWLKQIGEGEEPRDEANVIRISGFVFEVRRPLQCPGQEMAV